MQPQPTTPGRKCWPVLNGAVPPHDGGVVVLGWPVLRDCPGVTHNTLYAARRPLAQRCVCPRAVQLKRDHTERDAELKRAHRVNPSSKRIEPGMDRRNVDIWHAVKSDKRTLHDVGAQYGLSAQRVTRIVTETARRHPELEPRADAPELPSSRVRPPWEVVLPEELVKLDATQAACRVKPLGGTKDPAVVDSAFFPVSKGEHRRQAEEQAKTLCRTCPIQRDCLIYALQTNQAEGVWGGLTPTERRNRRTVALEMRSIQTYEEAK